MLQAQSILGCRGTVAAAFLDVTSLTFHPNPVKMCFSVFRANCNITPVHLSFITCPSGGKDSCYNMMQCKNAGHRIVALANLRPANTGVTITPAVFM